MNRRYSNLFRIFFAFSDLFALNFVNLILIQFFSQPDTGVNYIYTIFSMINNMIWLICAYSTAIYVTNKMLNLTRLIDRTLIAFMLFISIDFLLLFTFHLERYYDFILYSATAFLTFLFLSRLLFKLLIHFVYKTERYQKKIVFINCNQQSQELIRYFETHKKPTLILGYFDDDDSSSQIKYKYPYLGKVSDCLAYAKKNRITEIYSCQSPENDHALYELAELAEKNFIRFKFVPDFKNYINCDFYVDLEEGIPVLSLHREPLDDMTNRIKKRFFDIAFSAFVIIFFLSWMLPFIAVLIKLDSKGPVLFKQNRTGKNNRSFICLKLRTLQVNELADSLQVTRNDSRITPLGRFLRKSNLDELPQFFNVLAGSMSIVGSRPHMLKHTEEYSGAYDKYMIRHYLKPGITGWAQINGYRGEISEPGQLKSRVEHDIWYLENWNIWLDIRIVSRTFFSTLTGNTNAF